MDQVGTHMLSWTKLTLQGSPLPQGEPHRRVQMAKQIPKRCQLLNGRRSEVVTRENEKVGTDFGKEEEVFPLLAVQPLASLLTSPEVPDLSPGLQDPITEVPPYTGGQLWYLLQHLIN